MLFIYVTANVNASSARELMLFFSLLFNHYSCSVNFAFVYMTKYTFLIMMSSYLGETTRSDIIYYPSADPGIWVVVLIKIND